MATSPNTPASPVGSSSVTDALNRLWVRFLPEMESRLSVIERAATALAASELDENLRDDAHQAAHKLAGILGTFGLPRGTELARQAEHLLAEEVAAGSSVQLIAWLSELHGLINHRQG